MPFDLVLSSGFLAFGAQAGFLAGVEHSGVEVDGVCGTSSGALAGALWAAGHSAKDIFALLTDRPPFAKLGLHLRPWRGLFSMAPVIEELKRWLPPRIEDLPRPFAAGAMDNLGRGVLLRKGPLPASVAASCAVPWLFAPVVVSGCALADGGAVDRTGLRPWRALRGPQPTLLHLVQRSLGAKEELIDENVIVVRSQRSNAQLWSLGPVGERFESARAAAMEALRAAQGRRQGQE